MTWNGLQGFQTPIEPDSFEVDNMGTFGVMHQERGLTCKFVLIRLDSCRAKVLDRRGILVQWTYDAP